MSRIFEAPEDQRWQRILRQRQRDMPVADKKNGKHNKTDADDVVVE